MPISSSFCFIFKCGHSWKLLCSCEKKSQMLTKFSRLKDAISWIPACLPKMRYVQDPGCFTRVPTQYLGDWRTADVFFQLKHTFM